MKVRQKNLKHIEDILLGKIYSDDGTTEQYKIGQVAKIARHYISVVDEQKYTIKKLQTQLQVMKDDFKAIAEEIAKSRETDMVEGQEATLGRTVDQ